jgi:TonB family protein
MKVTIGIAAMGAAFVAAGGAHAQPAPLLQPIKPWVIHFDDTECYAERTFGSATNPVILGLRPSPNGDTYELLVAHKRAGPRNAVQLKGSVDFGHSPVKAWLLRYALTDRSYTLDKYRIDINAMTQARTSPIASFHVAGEPDDRFALAAVAEVLTTLDKCNVDLRQYWNMTDAEQQRIAAPAIGDVRGIFSDRDYPDEAWSRDQEGKVEFLLFVDEKGAVAACNVLTPSGIPALDGMGCQVIRKRAKFKAAIGRDGKPIRSAYVTPPVIWRMER